MPSGLCTAFGDGSHVVYTSLACPRLYTYISQCPCKIRFVLPLQYGMFVFSTSRRRACYVTVVMPTTSFQPYRHSTIRHCNCKCSFLTSSSLMHAASMFSFHATSSGIALSLGFYKLQVTAIHWKADVPKKLTRRFRDSCWIHF